MTEDRASKLKGFAWLAVGCVIGGFFAVVLSPLTRAIPWSWEQKLARTLPADPEPACRYDPKADAVLQKLVKRIYPVQPDDGDFSIDVRLVKDPTVNAYAGLGGQITVDSGLLKQAESPEELAGVLAHEIEHVHRRHIMEGALKHILTSGGIKIIFGSQSSLANLADYFLKMDFSRTQEAQADEGGLRRLQKAHVDNQGFRHFFERMGKSGAGQEFLSDHPSNESRIEMVNSFPNQDPTPVLAPGEWTALKESCADR